MSVTSILNSVQKTIIKYSPDILAAIAGIGVIGTGVLVYDGAVKTRNDIQVLEDSNPDASKADKMLVYAKNFWPAALMATTTEICIFGSNHINKQRIATLAGAYILRESNFKDYKDKVEEIVGGKKAQEIQDEVVADHMRQNPRTDSNSCPVYHPDEVQLEWWWDETSQRWFQTNIDIVRRAEVQANRDLNSPDNGEVSLNDIYQMIGLDPTTLAAPYVWKNDNNNPAEILIMIGSTVLDDGRVYKTVQFNLPKIEDEYSGSWFARC